MKHKKIVFAFHGLIEKVDEKLNHKEKESVNPLIKVKPVILIE
jgi:hypothetical protein